MANLKHIKTKLKSLKITMHPLFLVLGVILFFLGEIEIFIIYSISALVHEYGHFLVASKLGYRMIKIRLMPFGAELFGNLDSFDSRDELYIALAGPITNFIIVTIILGLWWLKPEMYNYTSEILKSNLVMGIFNLLPIFPLDGGRVILCFLSKKMPRPNAAKLVKYITKVFAILLFVLFILTSLFTKLNLSFGIMAFMLFFTASSAMQEATYQKIDLKTMACTKNMEWVIYSVPENMKIYELKKKHIKNKIILYIVLDAKGNLTFSFSELDLI